MSVLVDDIFPPPSVKEGRFDIITLLRFIDEVVVGTWNTIMDDAKFPDRKIECYPYKSDKIEQETGSLPDDGTVKRILTYRVRKSEPALLSGGTRDRAWRHRATIQEPDAMNKLGTPKVTDIMGKWVDYRIRFDCFAPSWTESQKLVLEVENLFDACTNYITSKGAVKFINEGRNADVYHMKTKYFYETLMYTARLEKVKVETGEAIQELWTMFDNGLMSITKG